MVECAPSVGGATPSSPQNGASGMRMPGSSSPCRPSRRVMRSACSSKSSVSRPKPGKLAVQPQSPGWKSSSSISSVSPGSAPSTAIGPLTWSTREKSTAFRSSTVELAVSWPLPASLASNSTTPPLATVAIGSIERSQARWYCSGRTWTDAAGALMPRMVRASKFAGHDLAIHQGGDDPRLAQGARRPAIGCRGPGWPGPPACRPRWSRFRSPGG